MTDRSPHAAADRAAPAGASRRRRAVASAGAGALDDLLGTALAGVASIATVVGLFLAVSWLGLWLWLPPIGRAIGLGVFFLLAAAAFAPLLALRLPSRQDGLRRLDRNSAAAASAGDRDRRRDRGPDRRFALGRALARAYRACAAGGHDAQGRRAGAAAGAARSVRVARAGGGAGGGDLRRRRRRADQAHRGGLRLARRDGAGQFPDRRLGVAADLYRPAAGDPAGPATGRAGADRGQSVGAGRQHAC